MNNSPKEYDSTKILLKVSNVISSPLNLKKICELVLRESQRALGADHASLFLTDDNHKHLILEQARGFTKDEIGNIKLLGSWEVINLQLVKRQKPLIVNNVNSNFLFKGKRLPFSREKLPVSSFIAAPLVKEREVIGVLIVSNKKGSRHIFKKEDMRLIMALSNHVAIALLNAKLYQDLRELFISTIKSLVRAVDAKDPYTGGHSERVMKYSIAIGKAMRLDDVRLENLGLSSLLHDVGKIGIEEELLSKPLKLSSREEKQMMLHPSIGVKIVETIKDAQKIILGIKEHHERFDGKGYPCRLKGNAISLEGRIIAVADTFDALTTDRPYRNGHSKNKAFLEIRRASHKQFDPSVIRAFIISYAKQPDIWNV